jgi:mRNA interferase MazF
VGHVSRRRRDRGSVEPAYQPDVGDFVWADLTLQSDREPAGPGAGLVLSPKAFNIATGLAFVCPITNQRNGGGVEVPLPRDLAVKGRVHCDKLKSLHWRTRQCEFRGRAPMRLVHRVRVKLQQLYPPVPACWCDRSYVLSR